MTFRCNIHNFMNFSHSKLTLLWKCSMKPWNAGKSQQRTISAHDLSVSQSVAGLGKGFSKATPPVSRNRHSRSSILPLYGTWICKAVVSKYITVHVYAWHNYKSKYSTHRLRHVLIGLSQIFQWNLLSFVSGKMATTCTNSGHWCHMTHLN